MKYKADKDVIVSGATRTGDAIVITFSKGLYETKDEDEIAFLDALAADPDHPVKAVKEKEA